MNDDAKAEPQENARIDDITAEMTVDQLIRILRTLSISSVTHEAGFKALKERNEELFEAQNILRENIETIRKLLEGHAQLLLRIVPRAGGGIEAN